MSRAQLIADLIMGSERYAQVFADRVYADEPILRTGRQVMSQHEGAEPTRTSNAGRDARQAPRERSEHVDPVMRAVLNHLGSLVEPEGASPGSGYVPQPRTIKMPAQYRAMRRLAKTHANWLYSSTHGSKLFYEQGKLMERFSDDYEGVGASLLFLGNYPTYAEMSDYELRLYITWRTRLRAGETPECPVAFLYVYAYELLCGIGVEPGQQGHAALVDLARRYEGASPAFDAHLHRWTHDYVVMHGLDASLLEPVKGSLSVEAVATLRRAEQALLAQAGVPVWPEVPSEGMPTSEELLDALCVVSRYRAERSKFVREHRADVALVCARVYARMVGHCHKRRKTDYVDGLFGMPVRTSYAMYPSAIYWSPTAHEDATYFASPSESYVCERGFWWRELPCRRMETSKELGALLHAIDCRMRVAMGGAPPLKARPLPKYQGKFVDDEIAALLEQRAAQEAARIRIDRRSLQGIRSASARTREALLTDDERDEDPSMRGDARPLAPVGMGTGLGGTTNGGAKPQALDSEGERGALGMAASDGLGSLPGKGMGDEGLCGDDSVLSVSPATDAVSQDGRCEARVATEPKTAALGVADGRVVVDESPIELGRPLSGQSPYASQDHGTLGLSERQLSILLALLDGAELPADVGHAFVSLEVDAINEAFLDVVGDTVIEFDADVPRLVEDYEPDVREALGLGACA